MSENWHFANTLIVAFVFLKRSFSIIRPLHILLGLYVGINNSFGSNPPAISIHTTNPFKRPTQHNHINTDSEGYSTPSASHSQQCWAIYSMTLSTKGLRCRNAAKRKTPEVVAQVSTSRDTVSVARASAKTPATRTPTPIVANTIVANTNTKAPRKPGRPPRAIPYQKKL